MIMGMMISKELYNEVGGFSEEYAVAFNDVDFCMKVREKGEVYRRCSSTFYERLCTFL